MNNFIEQINETLYDYKDKIKDISIDNIDVKNKILLYIKNTIDVFQELNAKELEDNEKFVSLLSSYLKLLNNFDIRNINFMIKNQKSQILHYFSNILDESRRLNFISSFSNSTNTAVIVGSNGSGKSTFVNSLSGSLLSNLTVIPAQKMLYFSKSTASRLTTSIEKYKSEYLKSTNNDFKLDEQEYDSRIKLFLPFTFMITALVNDLAQFSTNQRNDTKNSNSSKALWDKVEEVWNSLVPDISFHVNVIDRTIYAKKDGDTYSINGLSDGEKCILFYICNVLLSNEDGYIVVDEPETFLNPAIYNKLWDKLISLKPKCQFIFTSHNIEFINARSNSTLFWCKKVSLPDTLELINISDKKTLPVNLLTELLGSRKNILFCEGKLNSYDYEIFSKLFMDEYTIMPVDGHDNVIEYTDTFNSLNDWVNNNAIGIIDRDGMDSNSIEALKGKNIKCLPYNEIEMLLLDENIIKNILMLTKNDSESNKAFNNFKKLFITKMTENKSRILCNILKNRIDYIIKHTFINSDKYNDLDGLIAIVNDLPKHFNAEKIRYSLESIFNEYINNEDYEGLLSLCNLKGEIIRGMANKYIQPDYDKFVIARISKDENIKKRLIDIINLNSIK